ncbi:hypothetical protein VaNZ11_005257, partial [Volvox africanus]
KTLVFAVGFNKKRYHNNNDIVRSYIRPTYARVRWQQWAFFKSSSSPCNGGTCRGKRLMEHRRGCERYDDAVAYTAWKLQKHIKKDFGYKIWAVYNDCTTLYVTYWKLCYLFSTLTRLAEALAGSSSCGA